jgi:hypothetical protein
MAAAFSKGRVIAAGCSGCDDSTFVGRTGRANRQYQLATTGSSGTGTGTDRHGTAQPPPLRARGASRNGLWSRWSPLLPSHPRTETRARAQRQKPAAPRAAPFCSPWPRCFCEPSPPNAAQRCPGSAGQQCAVRGSRCVVRSAGAAGAAHGRRLPFPLLVAVHGTFTRTLAPNATCKAATAGRVEKSCAFAVWTCTDRTQARGHAFERVPTHSRSQRILVPTPALPTIALPSFLIRHGRSLASSTSMLSAPASP